MHEAREELARLSRDPKEAEIYRQRADAIAEKYNALLGAEEKGEIRGIKQGIEQGKIEMAKKSLKQGLDVKMISLITGLSIKEVENLKIL